jgi:DNA polymerase III delta subunit
MLYLFHGSDTTQIHTKAHGLVEALKKKQPDAVHREFDMQTLSEDALKSVVNEQGLFVSKYIVRLRELCGDENGWDIVKEYLKDIAESPHIFIFSEGKLLAPVKKKLLKHADKVEEFEEKKKIEKKFNVFLLTDAVAERNPKKSWVLYQGALQNGMAPEEIHGILFWQMKNIVSVRTAINPEEAGMKAFPFKKAQDALRLFGGDTAEHKMWELVGLYHQARQGKHDFGEATERWILNIRK